MPRTLKYKNFAPQDSRYVPLTQQRWLCVPTCIQIVMFSHNIPLFPAELMAHYFGVVVPKEDAKLFYRVHVSKRPLAGYGTQLREESAANKMFKELKIPLRMKWHLISEFRSLEEFRKYLNETKSEDIDVIACFDYKKLYRSGNPGGHVCVLDKIYLTKNKVRLVDPIYIGPKWRVVLIPDLYRAMVFHGSGNGAGFWKLSYTRRKSG